MKKINTILLFLCLSFGSIAQNILNMELLSNVNYPENCNDIWGYVAEDGSEYAILGTTEATAVLDLSDPTNPVELAYIEGATSTWRDMKQWGNYAYVTTDVGADGLLIIDMTNAPEEITWEFWQPDLEVGTFAEPLEKCHNIYIDEKGYAYLSGCNISNEGVIILDVFTTPGTPIYVGAADARYSHDAYARGDTLWSSDILTGIFSVWDVSDRTNPIELASQTTTTFFTHNAWLSTDGNYLFTTDERPDAFVDAYDVSDLSDIKLLDSYKPADTRDQGVIPHNVHYLDGGYLVISWYTDGVKIVDANRPTNLVEVGSYDTYTGNQTGFNGCWGVTPFLPSGLVIASDINTGLYVFNPTYVRACYLEGTVRSASNGMMLNDVEVVIESGFFNDTTSDPMGAFKTGQAEAGTFDVTFSKDGYFTKTVPAVLVNGEVTILDVELESLPTAAISVQTLRDADNNPIENAKVLIVSETFSYEATTDATGSFTLAEVFFDDYTIYAGAWGYENILFDENVTINADGEYTITLKEAYQDDFILDLGWESTGDAPTGIWERGVPVGTSFQGTQSNPGADISGDVGNQCYVTGNGGGGAGTDDIDDGTVILTSPIMDLTTYNSPMLSYNLWFLNAGGSGTPNDYLEVKLTNGTDEVILETLTSDDSAGFWRTTSEFDVASLIELTNDMRLVVTSADDDPGHLVEAAIDAFLVLEGEPNSIQTSINTDFELLAYPNPFSDQINVQFDVNGATASQLEVHNLLGQVIEVVNLNNDKGTLQIGANLPKGIYLIKIQADQEISKTIKIIKE